MLLHSGFIEKEPFRMTESGPQTAEAPSPPSPIENEPWTQKHLRLS
jgi:hypothetical protein